MLDYSHQCSNTFWKDWTSPSSVAYDVSELRSDESNVPCIACICDATTSEAVGGSWSLAQGVELFQHRSVRYLPPRSLEDLCCLNDSCTSSAGCEKFWALKSPSSLPPQFDHIGLLLKDPRQYGKFEVRFLNYPQLCLINLSCQLIPSSKVSRRSVESSSIASGVT